MRQGSCRASCFSTFWMGVPQEAILCLPHHCVLVPRGQITCPLFKGLQTEKTCTWASQNHIRGASSAPVSDIDGEILGFPSGSDGKESTCQCRFNPWVGKMPWRRVWQPTPIFLLGKSHGQNSLAGLQSMGLQRVKHDWATITFFFFHTLGFELMLLFLKNNFIYYWFIFGCAGCSMMCVGFLWLQGARATL